MTGDAYRRSAELAGVVGPYDGYARNAEPHKRVMRKHAAANDDAPNAPTTRARCCGRPPQRGDGVIKERRGERIPQRAGLGVGPDRLPDRPTRWSQLTGDWLGSPSSATCTATAGRT